MGLIKSISAPTNVQTFSLRDIETQARAILARATSQAEQILAGAQEQGERIKKEAHAQGLAAGRKEGMARGLEEGKKAGHQQALNEQKQSLTTAVTALTGALREIDKHRRDLEAGALRDVIELSIAIASRVTKRQGMLDPAVMEANLVQAMKLATHASDVRVALHPSQKSALEAALPALKLQWPKLNHVQIVEDATIAPGGCKVFTTHGIVEADLDGQLDRIIAELLPDQARSQD